jgi:hypothetical protein
MKRKLILSIVILSLFLYLPFAYCQELTSNELKIFYDAVEYQLKAQVDGNSSDSLAQDFASQYGLAEDELADIMVEGYRIPLSATEERVADELKKRLSSPKGEQMTPDDMNIMKELANQYGMSLGQVGSIFIRMNSDLL